MQTDAIREKLDDVILQGLDDLSKLEFGSEERSRGTKDLDILYKLKIDDMKQDLNLEDNELKSMAHNENVRQHKEDEELKRKELELKEKELAKNEAIRKKEIIVDCVKYSAGLVVNIGFFAAGMHFDNKWTEVGFDMETFAGYTVKTLQKIMNKPKHKMVSLKH